MFSSSANSDSEDDGFINDGTEQSEEAEESEEPEEPVSAEDRMRQAELERLQEELKNMGEQFVKEISNKERKEESKRAPKGNILNSDDSDQDSDSEAENDSEDGRPSLTEKRVTIVMPKKQTKDIVMPGLKAPSHKKIGQRDELIFDSSDDGDDDEPEKKEEQKPRRSCTKMDSQMRTLEEVCSDLGIMHEGDRSSGGSGNSGGEARSGDKRKLRPDCWWCLFSDRELEKTDVMAYELFLETYNRYISLPKIQLAKLLKSVWHKVIYVPSLEEGKEIPVMSEEMFYDHMVFHDKDPKSKQMDILDEMNMLRAGLAENFYITERVREPEGGEYIRTIPDLKRIDMYLKVVRQWENMASKDVTGWMGAKQSTLDGVAAQRRFSNWGTMKVETEQDRRARKKRRVGASSGAYRGRKLVLDGRKN